MRDARLILTCGLPGASKTTLAMQLAAERSAVRLTKDEWQRALGSSPWDRRTGEKIEQELWRLAQEILSLGLSVVLDFGLWARAERDELRTAARTLGVGVELHFLDAPPDVLWRRIEERNAAPPWDKEPIGSRPPRRVVDHLPGARRCEAGVVRRPVTLNSRQAGNWT